MSEDNHFPEMRSVSIPYISFNENVITDKLLRYLFCESKKAILQLEIYKLLKDLCDCDGKDPQKKYQNLYKISIAIAKTIKGRVTITLPDGHVVIDTCKDEGNTYENYIDDVISENHNSRISIFHTQYHPDGVSHERKFSSTTNQYEVCVAVRLGPYRNSAGTIRLSVPNC